MVSNTPERIFVDWFSAALDRAGVISGRGRPPAVARRYGVSTPAAVKWLNGTSLPASAKLLQIVNDLDGPYAKTELSAYRHVANHVRDSSNMEWASFTGPKNGYIRLGLLSMEASMGHGTTNDDPTEIVDFIDVAGWWADLHLPRPHERVKLITGRGDSNAPLINHGDIVFVDTMVDTFDGEGLYVFNWCGRALIKRLALNMRTNGLRIISANPSYPPEDIALADLDNLHISGRVIAWYTLRKC